MADLESPSMGRTAVAFQDGTKPYGPSETPGGSFAFTVISQYPWRTGSRTPVDKMFKSQTSLLIQWLRLYASSSESMGLIPVWGAKIPHATIWPKLKKTQKIPKQNKQKKMLKSYSHPSISWDSTSQGSTNYRMQSVYCLCDTSQAEVMDAKRSEGWLKTHWKRSLCKQIWTIQTHVAQGSTVLGIIYRLFIIPNTM